MWKSELPSVDSSEPVELRMLKLQLANLKCNCITCCKSKQYLESQRLVARSEKGVQWEVCDSRDPSTSDRISDISPFGRDIYCPSCSVTMNMLRGNTIKVVKDEEVNASSLTDEKSTGHVTSCINKCTSVTDQTVQKVSNVSFCDFLSECSSDHALSLRRRRSNLGRVKFKENVVELESGSDQTKRFVGNCLCLDNFIDSIRPPLEDVV